MSVCVCEGEGEHTLNVRTVEKLLARSLHLENVTYWLSDCLLSAPFLPFSVLLCITGPGPLQTTDLSLHGRCGQCKAVVGRWTVEGDGKTCSPSLAISYGIFGSVCNPYSSVTIVQHWSWSVLLVGSSTAPVGPPWYFHHPFWHP